MKNLALLGLVIISLVLIGCTSPNPENNTGNQTGNASNTDNGTRLANPASVYCEDQEGTLKFFEGQEGTVGICEFSDESACEEWKYYRNECTPGQCEVECVAIGTLSEGWALTCDGDTVIALGYANCFEGPSAGFCGSSTNAACQTDSDCKVGGCSGQVCGDAGDGFITTCEYRDCYNADAYGLSCQCVSGKCKWA